MGMHEVMAWRRKAVTQHCCACTNSCSWTQVPNSCFFPYSLFFTFFACALVQLDYYNICESVLFSSLQMVLLTSFSAHGKLFQYHQQRQSHTSSLRYPQHGAIQKETLNSISNLLRLSALLLLVILLYPIVWCTAVLMWTVSNTFAP